MKIRKKTTRKLRQRQSCLSLRRRRRENIDITEAQICVDKCVVVFAQYTTTVALTPMIVAITAN